jgi:hypothetical protein
LHLRVTRQLVLHFQYIVFHAITFINSDKETAMDETETNANRRATKRPPHLDAPAYLTKNSPVPAPKKVPPSTEPGRETPDPVRYGDWENKGIAIDF